MFFNFGFNVCKHISIERIDDICEQQILNKNDERNMYPQSNFFEKIRRTSSWLLLKQSCRRASMAIEAALVMPLFMFAMLNLNSFMELYETNVSNNIKLYEEVRTKASDSYLLSELGIDTEDEIVKVKRYAGKPAINIIGYDSFMMASKFVAKSWTGYSKNGGEDTSEAEETVFITPTGEAYHISDHCPYLKLSIRSIPRIRVDKERNLSGGIYYPCDKCKKGDYERVYITDYGTQYHTSLDCSYLKRTIMEVKISEVGERHSCSKCYGNNF